MPGQENKIGALWIREQRGGGEYLSGELTIDGHTQRIVVFRNSYRTDANRQPHYIVYRDQPLPSREEP